MTTAINALPDVSVVDLMCDPRLYQGSTFSSDGFHPNDAGYAIIGTEVARAAIVVVSGAARQLPADDVVLVTVSPDAVIRLRQALAGPLPGPAAQALMAPRPRREWPPGFNPARIRHAAGLLLVFPGATGRAHRADRPRRHARAMAARSRCPAVSSNRARPSNRRRCAKRTKRSA